MDVLYPSCAGLDVHKKTVVACVRSVGPEGKIHKEVRTFGTMTAHLLALLDWLSNAKVKQVAMESTGVYWKPIFNLLEGHFEVVLVNPQHLKRVPGRKTDVKDCEWIAQLLQCGLLQPSFIPPRPIRELRELTRQRVQLVGEKTAAVNRIQKTLEDANIKLASVASDILGKSGRAMIRALIGGEEDPAILAKLACGLLQKKENVLKVALRGRVSEHHRFLLQMLMDHVDSLERLIERLNRRIAALCSPFDETIRNLDTVPGINRRGAECLVAELGTDMNQFPHAANLASWAGLCPGNRQSGGKSQGGKMRKGNRWLRRLLVQCAWAASRKKESYLRAQYRRLLGRRGKKRAVVAVAHTLLTIIYHVMKRGVTYHELGENYFARLQPDQLTRSLVRRLERLGHKVTLETQGHAA